MLTKSDISLSVELQQLIQPDMAYHYGIIPKKTSEDSLSFYIKKSSSEVNVKQELELIFGKEVVLFPEEDSIINKTLSQYYRTGSRDSRSADFKISTDFLENLIREAKSSNSSDIHFEIFKQSGRIRLRIDGKLMERYKIKKEEYAELVNKIKIKSNLNITEKRLPQDGRIHYNDFDIRVSVLPTLYGEKIVMRILGRDTSDIDIDVLGMDEDEKKIYMEAVSASKGIVLISGPTGSGKTTTLYATLKLLNKITSNILTIEDPIEYTLEGINQVQLKEDIGLTFSSALRTFLRQDPDIIMLGEIRDEKTAQMAIRASLTGHLVLSTIHTNSALGTISRLIDMGVPSFLISETLRISVAQRLVRKLCPDCKEKTIYSEKDMILRNLEQITYHYIPVGCNNCFHTGYKGRVAIYELIPVNQEVAYLIKNNDTRLNTIKYEKLSQKANQLVKKGITSIEEVYTILIEDKSNHD